MEKKSARVWLAVLVVLGVCNVTQLVVLVRSSLLSDGEDGGSRRATAELSVEERADAAAKRCERLERLLRSRLSALDESEVERMRTGGAIDSAVAARLDVKRAEARGRFTDEMIREIELSLGRKIDAEDRAEVAEANREYFASIDEVSEDETSEEKSSRLAGAAKAREGVIANLASDKDDPDVLVNAAMNAL